MENSVTTAMAESNEPEAAQSFNETSPVRRAGLFYKLVVPSILQDKKLKIPNKFAKKFEDDLSDLVTLVAPNGYRWVLELKRHGRRLWFEEGWHDFVKHHCIQVGQLLVFRFEGNSIFNFYMFNLTATSNASFEQIDNEQSPVTFGKEAEYEKLVEIFGTSSPDPSPCPPDKKAFCEFPDQQKFNGSCNGTRTSIGNFVHWIDTENLHPLKDFYNPFKDLDKLQVLKSNRDNGIQFDGKKLAKARENLDFQLSDETDEGAKKKKLKAEPIDYYNEPLLEKKCGNIPHKIRRVTFGVEEFKPGNPFCWIVMRQSYVRRGFHLHIPSKFAEKYLKGISGDITLQVSSGKQWRVRCIREGPGTKLSRGWADFVAENDLKEEDVCVFELIDMKDIVLKVTVFRVHGDPTKT